MGHYGMKIESWTNFSFCKKRRDKWTCSGKRNCSLLRRKKCMENCSSKKKKRTCQDTEQKHPTMKSFRAAASVWSLDLSEAAPLPVLHSGRNTKRKNVEIFKHKTKFVRQMSPISRANFPQCTLTVWHAFNFEPFGISCLSPLKLVLHNTESFGGLFLVRRWRWWWWSRRRWNGTAQLLISFDYQVLNGGRKVALVPVIAPTSIAHRWGLSILFFLYAEASGPDFFEIFCIGLVISVGGIYKLVTAVEL